MPGFTPPAGPHNFADQYFRDERARNRLVDRGIKGTHEAYIEMTKTAATGITQNAFATVPGWVVAVNDSGMTVSGTGFTVPWDGVWLVGLEYEWTPGTGVQRITQLRGSTTGILLHDLTVPGSSTYTGNTLSGTRRLVQNETIYAYVYHDNPGVISWGGNQRYLSCMTALYLRST